MKEAIDKYKTAILCTYVTHKSQNYEQQLKNFVSHSTVLATNYKQVLERTDSPTFLTLLNNTVLVALFNYSKL
jgi:ABC-type maltose transport system permease subunit